MRDSVVLSEGSSLRALKEMLCLCDTGVFWLVFGRRLIRQCSNNGGGGLHGAFRGLCSRFCSCSSRILVFKQGTFLPLVA